MQDARIRLALAVVGLLVLAGSGFGLYWTHKAAPPAVIITPPPQLASAEASSVSPPATPALAVHRLPQKHLAVDVAGAVRHPWLYLLPPGSRVMQAVQAAGGPAPDADLDAVNLAEPIQDGEKVFIPTRHDALVSSSPPAPPGNTLGHISMMPKPAVAPAAVSPSLPTVIEPGQPAVPSAPAAKEIKGKKGGVGKSDKITSAGQGQVALNTADAAQLERLPGVGPAMAARILAFRAQAHSFQSIDELQEVSGIGPKKYAKIAPLVTLN